MVCTSEVNTITIISVLGIIIYLVFNNNNKNKSEFDYDKKIKLLDQMINESKKDIRQKINFKEKQHQENISVNTSVNTLPNLNQNIYQNIKHLPPIISNDVSRLSELRLPNFDPVMERDRAVINDQLYPPLGRTERPFFDQLAARMASGLIAYPTRGSPDTFRMIGYLANTSEKKDTWKLFGRQKYPGSSQGEYYAIPVDSKKSDMKITIKDDMMGKEKIRDIYALPNEVTINSPLFNPTPYKLIELDKSDLTSTYI